MMNEQMVEQQKIVEKQQKIVEKQQMVEDQVVEEQFL